METYVKQKASKCEPTYERLVPEEGGRDCLRNMGEFILLFTALRRRTQLVSTAMRCARVSWQLHKLLKIKWCYSVETQQRHTIISTLVWLHVSVFSRPSSDQYFTVEGTVGAQDI